MHMIVTVHLYSLHPRHVTYACLHACSVGTHANYTCTTICIYVCIYMSSIRTGLLLPRQLNYTAHIEQDTYKHIVAMVVLARDIKPFDSVFAYECILKLKAIFDQKVEHNKIMDPARSKGLLMFPHLVEEFANLNPGIYTDSYKAGDCRIDPAQLVCLIKLIPARNTSKQLRGTKYDPSVKAAAQLQHMHANPLAAMGHTGQMVQAGPMNDIAGQVGQMLHAIMMTQGMGNLSRQVRGQPRRPLMDAPRFEELHDPPVDGQSPSPSQLALTDPRTFHHESTHYEPRPSTGKSASRIQSEHAMHAALLSPGDGHVDHREHPADATSLLSDSGVRRDLKRGSPEVTAGRASVDGGLGLDDIVSLARSETKPKPAAKRGRLVGKTTVPMTESAAASSTVTAPAVARRGRPAAAASHAPSAAAAPVRPPMSLTGGKSVPYLHGKILPVPAAKLFRVWTEHPPIKTDIKVKHDHFASPNAAWDHACAMIEKKAST